MQSVSTVAASASQGGPCGRVTKMAGQKTVKFPQEDLDMIEAAGRRFDWVGESDLIRIAIRVGLESLLADASPLGMPPLKVSRFSDDDPTPPLPPPKEDTTKIETTADPGKPAKPPRAGRQTRESKRALDRLDKTGKKARGRSEGIGG